MRNRHPKSIPTLIRALAAVGAVVGTPGVGAKKHVIANFHGLRASASVLSTQCKDLENGLHNTDCLSIEYGAGDDGTIWTSLPDQAKNACVELERSLRKKYLATHADPTGYNNHGSTLYDKIESLILLGHSSGAVIARNVLTDCEFKDRNFVTDKTTYLILSGGPNRGVSGIPTGLKEELERTVTGVGLKVIYEMVASSKSSYDNIIGPLGYVYNPTKFEAVVGKDWRSGKFITEQNNERGVSDDAALRRKQRMSKLKGLLLIQYGRENLILPAQSEWFALHTIEGLKRMEHTGKWWTEDYLGMRYLSESGKLSYFLTGTNHVHLRKQDLEASIINFIRSKGRFPINPNPIYGNLRFITGPDVTKDMLKKAFFISKPLKKEFNFGGMSTRKSRPAVLPTGRTVVVHGVPTPGRKTLPKKKGDEKPKTTSSLTASSASADTQWGSYLIVMLSVLNIVSQF